MYRVKLQNIAVGILMIVVGVIAFIMTMSMPPDASLFPRITIGLFVLLGLLLIILSAMDVYGKDGPSLVLRELKQPAISFAVIAAYIILMKPVGFYVTTAAFMITYMKVLKASSWRVILLTTAGMLAFTYVLFTWQFKVFLPRGILM